MCLQLLTSGSHPPRGMSRFFVAATEKLREGGGAQRLAAKKKKKDGERQVSSINALTFD